MCDEWFNQGCAVTNEDDRDDAITQVGRSILAASNPAHSKMGAQARGRPMHANESRGL